MGRRQHQRCSSFRRLHAAKSLPVHCIVEAIHTLDENRPMQHGVWRRRPMIEIDTYVIIPVATPFHNLVHAALLRLGYSAESAAAAKGSVLIKNWKALTFDQISDDPLITVGDILGELSTVATLRIQVFRGRPGTMADIKDKLLRFLLLQSHGLLISSGCPLDEILISQLCRNNSSSSGPLPEISEEIRRKFDQWWTTQFSPQSPVGRSQFVPSYPNQYSVPSQPPAPIERTITDAHPAMQTVHSQFPTQKTRMRTSFDPELELPKLQRWFTENQHPSRQQIQQYVKELNSLESRRGRKPLDINNVVYWFKNARAAQKRAEIRNVTTSNLQCHLSVNGYSNHSPTNGGGFLLADNYLNSDRLVDHRLKNNLSRRGPQNSHTSDEFSNTGSDLEDEEMPEGQPPSPTAPLSLTTRKDSRDGSPRSSTPPPPPDIQIESCKEEPKDESTNYNTDHLNNSKLALSDTEDDAEGEGDSKVHFEGGGVTSPANRSLVQRFCNSPDMDSQLIPRNPEGLDRLAAGFPLVPNSMFSHSIMYMSHYIPGLSHSATSPPSSTALAMSSLTADERRKRNRTFIDPVTEVPRLEQWFSLNTHPSHNLILKYTEELNCMAYRQKFPRLEPKNVQFWFKNRRAKCKRLKMSLFDNQTGQYHHSERESL
ncbi:DNA-binding protein SATB1 isoform X2 [Anoplophora glabripennis]|uniref:DNA-binding protein SATB1 isoform X2 n=1 Tax=Anoplophora glabripennis TaxID=217634 RepID=UPI000873C1B5|nr:DNA-binding protein SATB1 isoform X2 [Anoplophora glabripennis]